MVINKGGMYFNKQIMRQNFIEGIAKTSSPREKEATLSNQTKRRNVDHSITFRLFLS